MSIETILASINNGEIKKHIKEQYEKELVYIGELEAIEFARFRADAAADMLAAETTRTEATPHEIIQNMLDKGMDVWACVSDKSYDDARDKIGQHTHHRFMQYYTDGYYHPVWTRDIGWKYAVPIDTATMTEITGERDGLPKQRIKE